MTSRKKKSISPTNSETLGNFLKSSLTKARELKPPNNRAIKSWISLISILQKIPATQGGGVNFFNFNLNTDPNKTETLLGKLNEAYTKIYTNLRIIGINNGIMNLYFTDQDLYFDLFNMWLEGRHDKYYDYIDLNAFLNDTDKNKSYLAHFGLIPQVLINKFTSFTDANLPEDLQILKSKIIHLYNKKYELRAKFEYVIKNDIDLLNMYSNGPNYIKCDIEQTVKIEGVRYSVSIDQESENKHISNFIQATSSLEPACLLEQYEDPGAEIVKDRSSYSVVMDVLNELDLESPLFFAGAETKIYHINDDGSNATELYSTQVGLIPNYQAIDLSTIPIMSYIIKIPQRNNRNKSQTFTINTRTSAGAAIKNGAEEKLGKLLGDRQQALGVLYNFYLGDQTLILGTGDTSLMNEYNHLFKVMKKSLVLESRTSSWKKNYAEKLPFVFLFDSGSHTASTLANSVLRPKPLKSNTNKVLGVIMFGDMKIIKPIPIPKILKTIKILYSRRTQIEKNLRNNLFKTINNSYLTKPAYLGHGNNIVRRAREAFFTISKNTIGNNKLKLNNIKKKNCDLNGNPVNAPRRKAQKEIVRRILNVASQKIVNNITKPKPTSNNYLNAIRLLLKNYKININLPQTINSKIRINLCSKNNIARIEAKQKVLGNQFTNSNMSSGSGNLTGNNKGVEVTSRPFVKKSRVQQLVGGQISNKKYNIALKPTPSAGVGKKSGKGLEKAIPVPILGKATRPKSRLSRRQANNMPILGKRQGNNNNNNVNESGNSNDVKLYKALNNATEALRKVQSPGRSRSRKTRKI